MWIRRYLGSIVTVLLLVIAALSVPWLTARRPLSSELQTDRTISVVASGDSGAGTLREALFTAAQDPERVRIIIHPRQIRLRTPLPPVLGAKGVVIDAMSSRCELDGAGVAGGPLLEILSPATTVAGLGLKNAREEGIVVRANNVLLRGMTLTKCGDGVSVAGTSEQISIEDSTFVENTSGLRISPESRSVFVRNNEFQRNEQAGIWASAAAPETGSERPIIIQRNRFEADRISIALINVAGLIQSNEIRLNREIGIYLLGSPAIARSNTIHGGAIGILTDSAHGAIVELNQIDRTTQVALLVRDSRGLAVTRNRVYSNAFGLAVIFGDPASPAVLSDNLVLANTLDGIYVVGASPLIRGNEVIQNGAAAVRILDFVPWNAPRVPARPRLEANTFRANLINDAIRGEYRPPEDKE